MSDKFIISPSILSANFAKLGEGLTALKDAGITKIHLDVMDGHFVPNISFGLPVIKSLINQFDFIWDAHLMVSNPDTLIADFAKAGVHHVTVHAETCPHLHRTIQLIKSHGMTAGVALNPATSISALDVILKDIDLVLVMSVNPGFGGQVFIDSQLAKITQIRARIDALGQEISIQVDGGIHEKTYQKVIDAGANDIVMGSAIFKQPIDQYSSYINSFYAH